MAMKKRVRGIEPLFLRLRRRDVRQQSRLFAVWNQSDGK